LSPSSQEWLRAILEDFVLEGYHVQLLVLAAECLDRAAAAREFLAEHGQTYQDDRDNTKAYPQCRIVEAAIASHRQLVRECGLDVCDPGSSHPATIKGHSHLRVGRN